jgi:hypothetical protein
MSAEVSFQLAAKYALKKLNSNPIISKYIQKGKNSTEYHENTVAEYNRRNRESLLNSRDTDILKFTGFYWVEDDKAHWSPYLKLLNIDGKHTGIVIPQVTINTARDGISPNDTCTYTTQPAIELLVLSFGRISLPNRMKNNKQMVLEFEEISDFISYLEEEMAKGNYPRHLSSDWK